MNAYLDSSVILRLVLGEPGKFTEWNRTELRISSRLVEVECLRSLDRLKLGRDLPENEVVIRREALFDLLDTVELFEISRPVLKRASEPFPVALGTLDAIHLATALLWNEETGREIVMATHDKALGLASRSVGIKVLGI